MENYELTVKIKGSSSSLHRYNLECPSSHNSFSQQYASLLINIWYDFCKGIIKNLEKKNNFKFPIEIIWNIRKYFEIWNNFSFLNSLDNMEPWTKKTELSICVRGVTQKPHWHGWLPHWHSHWEIFLVKSMNNSINNGRVLLFWEKCLDYTTLNYNSFNLMYKSRRVLLNLDLLSIFKFW